MTLQEALLEGLRVTASGLIIVFSVLVILMVVLVLMKKIFYKEPENAVKTEKAVPVVEKTVPAPAPVQNTPADDGELIAVLTAAIAASLNTSTYNLQIKSYRRIGQNAPAWNRAGINETINIRY